MLEPSVLKLDLNQPFIVPDVGKSVTIKLIYDFVLHLASRERNEYSFEDSQVRFDERQFVIAWTFLAVERPLTARPQLLSDIGISSKDTIGSQEHLACTEPYSVPSLLSTYMQLPNDHGESDDSHEASNYRRNPTPLLKCHGGPRYSRRVLFHSKYA